MPSSSSSSSSSGRGASPRTRRAARRFLRASRRGDLRAAKKRLRRHPGIDIERRDRRTGRTALHLACDAGAEDLIAFLIDRGADVTRPDARGATPAHLLARHAATRPNALHRLRRAGADLARAADANGRTPNALAERAVERHLRAVREAEERRRARSVDEDEYEGLGDRATRDGSADASRWRRKLADEAARESTLDEFGGLSRGETALDELRAFLADHDESDAAEPAYAFGAEEAAFEAYEAAARKSANERTSYISNPSAAAANAQARATAARDAEAQRILDEARSEDAAWRRRVASGSGSRGGDASASAFASAFASETDLAATYRRRWGVFAAKAARVEREGAEAGGGSAGPPRGRHLLGFADVPWPAREGAGLEAFREALERDVPRGDLRKALRAEMLRWHPDKFGGRFGKALRAEDRERIARRVAEVATRVAELYKRSSRNESDA